jgi:flagellar biosynthesis component FlhA
VEPVFHLPATWITDVERKNAEVAGFTVVDAASVLVTHLSETIKRNCHEILSRQDVQMLLDNLKQTHPTVVNELIPAQLTVGQVQRILQNLLAEGISIRNLAGILEKVSDYAAVSPDELPAARERCRLRRASSTPRTSFSSGMGWTRSSNSRLPMASARRPPMSRWLWSRASLDT